MTHQPFEELLFLDPERAGKGLSEEEALALREHLDGCAECRALAGSWAVVDAALRSEPVIGPFPGFTARWQARLELDHKRLHRRQSLAALLFSLTGAVLLLGTLVLLALPVIESPELLLATVVSRLLGLMASAGAAREFLTALLMNAGRLPLLGWVLLVGVGSQLAVLWFIALRYFSNPRRVTE